MSEDGSAEATLPTRVAMLRMLGDPQTAAPRLTMPSARARTSGEAATLAMVALAPMRIRSGSTSTKSSGRSPRSTTSVTPTR